MRATYLNMTTPRFPGCFFLSLDTATQVVPAESADVTSPPDDLEAQVTPVLTYSAEDESTKAEGAGLSTPAGNMVERGRKHLAC